MKKPKGKTPATNNDYREYVAHLPLQNALWWFIENANHDLLHRSEIFFALRERVRLHNALPETHPQTPRVLVIVKGGIADYVSDAGVDVELFDRDDMLDDPSEGGVPRRFADLATPRGIPVLDEAEAS